jgi:hypothetical protein
LNMFSCTFFLQKKELQNYGYSYVKHNKLEQVCISIQTIGSQQIRIATNISVWINTVISTLVVSTIVGPWQNPSLSTLENVDNCPSCEHNLCSKANQSLRNDLEQVRNSMVAKSSIISKTLLMRDSLCRDLRHPCEGFHRFVPCEWGQ